MAQKEYYQEVDSGSIFGCVFNCPSEAATATEKPCKASTRLQALDDVLRQQHALPTRARGLS